MAGSTIEAPQKPQSHTLRVTNKAFLDGMGLERKTMVHTTGVVSTSMMCSPESVRGFGDRCRVL